MNHKSVCNNNGRPAPQLFTVGELSTICNLLEREGMREDEIYVKMAILRNYALQHEMETGRAFLPLQAG